MRGDQLLICPGGMLEPTTMGHTRKSATPGTPPGMTRKESFKHGLLHEVKKFILFTFYFWIWFYAINLYTSALLEANGMAQALPAYTFLFIALKAAIIAKFLITAELVFPMGLKKKYPLIFSLLAHSLVYLAVVLLLSVLEKGMEGLVHHKGFINSMLAFEHADPKLIAIIAFIYWLIILHCLVYAAVEYNIGGKQIRKIMLEKS